MRANRLGRIKLKIYNNFYCNKQKHQFSVSKKHKMYTPSTASTSVLIGLMIFVIVINLFFHRGYVQLMPLRSCNHMWKVMNNKIILVHFWTPFPSCHPWRDLPTFKKRTRFYIHLKRMVDEVLSKHILLSQIQIDHQIAEVSKTCIQKSWGSCHEPVALHPSTKLVVAINT